MSMTPQEREVISGIFERLKQGAATPRDPEAERFIADLIAQQPYAPYLMAQSSYVHEQAITTMQSRIQELEAQQAQKPAQSGGFLSGLFGGSPQPAPQPAPRQAPPPPQQQYAPPPQGGPWGQQPQYGQPQQGAWGGQPQAPAGGGFLSSALTTATGVAGGMLAANALSSMFSGHHSLGGDSSALSGFGGGSASGVNTQGYQNGYQDAQQDAEDDQHDDADAQQNAYDDGVADADDSYDSGGDDN
jgi:hypothetical protein